MAKYRIPSDYKNQTSRAQHNWASPSYGTFHPGLAIPVHHRHLNVGDRIRGRIQDLVQSQPMLGPLMNGFKQVTIATFTPDSVLYGWMRNGKRYSPDEYKNFSKYYFDPSSFSDVKYDDPVFKQERHMTPLVQGLNPYDAVDPNDPAGEVKLTPFDQWASDFAIRKTPTSSPQLRHVGRGGLWDWLGVAAGAVSPRVPGGGTSPGFKWNVAPFFAYFLSHYYYIANMQEDHMYFTRGLFDLSRIYGGKDIAASGLSFEDIFCSLDPNDVLDFLALLNMESNRGSAGSIIDVGLESWSVGAMFSSGVQNGGGLLAVPYSPDLFGNIIKQGSSPSVDIISVFDPADPEMGAQMAVPELRLKTKIQNWMDRLFVSNGRISDVYRTLWGVNSSPEVNKPDFLGVWQAGINPSNVVATANGVADDESMNVGQMAARIDRWSDYGGRQGIDYYAKEPGTFMLITMLVPQPAYFQGLHPDLVGTSFADDYNPELPGIGFQAVPRHRFSMMPEDFANPINEWFAPNDPPVAKLDPLTVSVGEEVAWSWLRTDYARLHGEFAQNGVYQYWVLARRFSEYYVDRSNTASVWGDYHYYGTYVNPMSWQYLFVGQSLADPNFCYYGNFDLKVVSSLPANYMPYLGR